MGDYDEVVLSKYELQSEALLKEKANEDDRESSDDGSTIVGTAEWKKCGLKSRQTLNRKVISKLLVCLIVLMASIISLLIWLISLQGSHHEDTANENVRNEKTVGNFQTQTGITCCGTTSVSAIAAGCHFDIFSFGWMPPECTDSQLYRETIATLENQTEGAWIFYTHQHDPIPLSAFEDYGSGEVDTPLTDDFEIKATWEHYLVACTYGWQKVQRATMRGWPLDEWSASYALAQRCGPHLVERHQKESESVQETLRAWFPVCGLEAEQMKTEIETVISS